MSENRIGELIQKAKGDDRSLREYARDSGVDAAIISKIINGVYIPKNKKIYMSLTSSKAAPRGGVTFEQMVEAADSSKSYKEGVVAGKALTAAALMAGTPLALMTGVPIFAAGALGVGAAVFSSGLFSKTKKGEIDEAINELQRFIAVSDGLILGVLGAKGIPFQIANKRNEVLDNQFDKYINLNDKEIKEYILRYAYIPDDQKNAKYVFERIPRTLVEELAFLEPSKERKVTIVTNAVEAFNKLLYFKNRLSYNGELSIILIDLMKAELCREEYISHFVGEDAPSELLLV